MRSRFPRLLRTAAALAVTGLVLGACSSVVAGTGRLGNAPNASLPVLDNSHSSLDQSVENALTDVEAFWELNYPKVSGGKALPPIKGGYYSIDGEASYKARAAVGAAKRNECIDKDYEFIINNGAYCELDDSISWDRSPGHLFGQLAKKYGSFVVALIFAHEFGHAVQQRQKIFGPNVPTIDTESQADCAAGAWAASALKGQDPHYRTVTPAELDRALNGFLLGRDPVPDPSRGLTESHGNGFDRLAAIADGEQNGVTYCFSSKYFDRTFTERGYSDSQAGVQDRSQNGNESLNKVLDPAPIKADGSGGGGLQPDLNRFWTAEGKVVHKTFRPVKIAEAAHPPCDQDTTSQFDYCPSTNTVYYSSAFARQAYYSLPDLTENRANGNLTVTDDTASDFALGTLFVVGWGLAVRHQFFGGEMNSKNALLTASCYAGAYSHDINDPNNNKGKDLLLSPPDLDEASSSMLNLVGLTKAYGARGTTGLTRIQSFVQGYNGGLSACND